jgi:hypothetical protein
VVVRGRGRGGGSKFLGAAPALRETDGGGGMGGKGTGKKKKEPLLSHFKVFMSSRIFLDFIVESSLQRKKLYESSREL